MKPTEEILSDLWSRAGEAPTALDRVAMTGEEPVLPGIFRVAAAAGATVGAAGLAAAELHRVRGGGAETVRVDLRTAALAFRSERYLRIDGGPPPALRSVSGGFHETADGRWIQLHTAFDHHRAGVLALLGCDDDNASIAAGVARHDAFALEDALAERGLPATVMRTPPGWREHGQGAALAHAPLIEIERIGDAVPEPLAADDRPLGGVRVLDLTRVIAGPVAGRTLAMFGADVVRIGAGHLPSIPPLVIDTGFGKRAAHVDLRTDPGVAALESALRRADVFIQGYRPGAIAGRGFPPERAAEIRPGVVYVSLCAYGYDGPWSGRRGFDSLVQTASGIASECAAAKGSRAPVHLPCQALDHATGYLAAFGASLALRRRHESGGSWHVRVALAQTGRWLEGLGRIDALDAPDPGFDAVGDVLARMPSSFGELTHVRPALDIDGVALGWRSPPVPLGTHSIEHCFV